jgi:hypothetical protein
VRWTLLYIGLVEREQYKLLEPSPQLKIYDIFHEGTDAEEFRIM